MPDDDDPLVFAPGTLEKIQAKCANDPKLAEAMREMLANLRQAHVAWRAGQYASFEDAMEAITGQRPQAVD